MSSSSMSPPVSCDNYLLPTSLIAALARLKINKSLIFFPLMEKKTDGGEWREEVIDRLNDVSCPWSYLWPSSVLRYEDTTTPVAAGCFIWISHHKTLFIIIIKNYLDSSSSPFFLRWLYSPPGLIESPKNEPPLSRNLKLPCVSYCSRPQMSLGFIICQK